MARNEAVQAMQRQAQCAKSSGGSARLGLAGASSIAGGDAENAMPSLRSVLNRPEIRDVEPATTAPPAYEDAGHGLPGLPERPNFDSFLREFLSRPMEASTAPSGYAGTVTGQLERLTQGMLAIERAASNDSKFQNVDVDELRAEMRQRVERIERVLGI